MSPISLFTIFLITLIFLSQFTRSDSFPSRSYKSLPDNAPIKMTDLNLPHTSPLPVLFLSHAAPCLLHEERDAMMGCWKGGEFAQWLRTVPAQLGLIDENKPAAIIQFSAHYESQKRNTIEILAQDNYNGLYYDFGGFPDYTYQFKYPAPGNYNLAKLMQQMLQDAIPTVNIELNTERKLDHGTFVPISFLYPDAEIPIIQISIIDDPKLMRKLGEVLAPLRSRGILLGGNGQFSHNMRMLFSNTPPQWEIDQKDFIDKFTVGVTDDPQLTPEQNYANRSQTIDSWKKMKGANIAHPSHEHFTPIAPTIGLTKPLSGNDHVDKLFVIGDQWLGKHCLRSVVWSDNLPFTNHKKVIPQQTKDEL